MEDKQGTDMTVSLGGIVRNTPGSVCADGEMEEIVNMRFRDGSWRPCGDAAALEGAKIEYSDIYIHTNTYRHLLGVKDGGLWWFASLEEGEYKARESAQRIADVEGGVQMTQTGHLITAVSGKGLNYALWNEAKGEYRALNADYNGAGDATWLVPEGLVDLRVSGIEDEKGRALYAYLSEKTLSLEVTERYDPSAVGEACGAVLKKAYSTAEECGLLARGYFLACTAVELYDGSYILPSRPVLLAPPYIVNESPSFWVGDSVTGEVNREVCDSYDKNPDDKWDNGALWFDTEGRDVATQMHWWEDMSAEESAAHGNVRADDMAEGFDAAVFAYQDVYKYDVNKSYYVGEDEETGEWKGYNEYNHIKAVNVKPYRPYHIYINTKDENDGGGDVQVFMAANRLQFRMNRDIDQNFRNIVRGISVFMTEQIRWLDYDDKDGYELHWNQVRKAGNEDWSQKRLNKGYYEVYAPTRKVRNSVNAEENGRWPDVVKDIERLPAFYKVCSIAFDNIKKGDWTDIDLKERGVLKNLTEQERLESSSLSRDSYMPKVSYMYNGRLHIANYRSRLFRGFPLNYFFFKGGNGQADDGYGWYDRSAFAAADMEKPMAWVEVEIEKDDGKATVVREVPVESSAFQVGGQPRMGLALYDLNPMVSYPDTRAKKMTVVVQVYDREQPSEEAGPMRAEFVFNLTAHPYLNLAYAVNPYLTPVIVQPLGMVNRRVGYYPEKREYDELLSLPENVGDTEEVRNGLKVSAVENPMYFSAASTYRVGNMAIMAMAANVAADMARPFGDAPLYVFSEDGIHGLFVDSSGLTVYSNARPVSREICNNPKSVTQTDNAVIFTTARGLMSISGMDVRELSESVEGAPLDFTSPGSDGYIKEAALCISHERLVTLSGVMSRETFLEYIKGAVIGYNYHERELWVSNPGKPYSYILSNGAWSKRSVACSEFVTDWPRLYMVSGGALLDMTRETPAVQQTMFLTRPIKLGTMGFKQAYRAILRSLLIIPADTYSNIRTIDLRTLDLSPKKRVINIENPVLKEIRVDHFNPEVQEITVQTVVPEEIILGEGTKLEIDCRVKVTLSGLKIDSFRSEERDGSKYLIYRVTGSASLEKADSPEPADNASYSCDTEIAFGVQGTFKEPQGDMTKQSWTDSLTSTFPKGVNQIEIDEELEIKDINEYKSVIIGTHSSAEISAIHVSVDATLGLRRCVELYSRENHWHFTVTKEQSFEEKELQTLIEEIQEGVYPTNIYATNITVPIPLVPDRAYRLTYEVDGTAYVFLYIGDGTPLPYNELLDKIKGGEYPDAANAVTPDPLRITSRYVSVTTPSGTTIRAVIPTVPEPSGENPAEIYYRDLITGTATGKYPAIPTHTPSSIAIENGSAIELHNPDGTVDSFIYRGKSPISYTELRRLVDEGHFDPVTTYSENTLITIRDNENIELNIKHVLGHDGTYTFTYKGDSAITLGELMDNITSGLYPEIPGTDADFPFIIKPGTPLIFTDRDGNTTRLIYNGQENTTLADLLDYIAEKEYKEMTSTLLSVAGLYVFGSYDSRRWALIGAREHPGTIRDLGCITARVDCKYFRILFAARLAPDSTVEHLDISASASLLRRKPR